MIYETQSDIHALRELHEELVSNYQIVYGQITKLGHIGHLDSAFEAMELYLLQLESEKLGNKSNSISLALEDMIISEKILANYIKLTNS